LANGEIASSDRTNAERQRKGEGDDGGYALTENVLEREWVRAVRDPELLNTFAQPQMARSRELGDCFDV